MVHYVSPGNNKSHTGRPQRTDKKSNRHKRLTLICNKTLGIANELFSPIDVANRFINLTLQTIDENSQSREFLLESKKGIRKTSHLLKRLTRYAKEAKKEIKEINEISGSGKPR